MRWNKQTCKNKLSKRKKEKKVNRKKKRKKEKRKGLKGILKERKKERKKERRIVKEEWKKTKKNWKRKKSLCVLKKRRRETETQQKCSEWNALIISWLRGCNGKCQKYPLMCWKPSPNKPSATNRLLTHRTRDHLISVSAYTIFTDTLRLNLYPVIHLEPRSKWTE